MCVGWWVGFHMLFLVLSLLLMSVWGRSGGRHDMTTVLVESRKRRPWASSTQSCFSPRKVSVGVSCSSIALRNHHPALVKHFKFDFKWLLGVLAVGRIEFIIVSTVSG